MGDVRPGTARSRIGQALAVCTLLAAAAAIVSIWSGWARPGGFYSAFVVVPVAFGGSVITGVTVLNLLQRRGPRSARLLREAVLCWLLTAASVVICIVLTPIATADGAADSQLVRFGRPFAGVKQKSQVGVTDGSTQFGSPYERATTYDWPLLALNVFLVVIVLAVATRGWRWFVDMSEKRGLRPSARRHGQDESERSAVSSAPSVSAQD